MAPVQDSEIKLPTASLHFLVSMSSHCSPSSPNLLPQEFSLTFPLIRTPSPPFTKPISQMLPSRTTVSTNLLQRHLPLAGIVTCQKVSQANTVKPVYCQSDKTYSHLEGGALNSRTVSNRLACEACSCLMTELGARGAQLTGVLSSLCRWSQALQECKLSKPWENKPVQHYLFQSLPQVPALASMMNCSF